MADEKISQLTDLPTPADDDMLVVADTPTTNKRVTVANLATKILSLQSSHAWVLAATQVAAGAAQYDFPNLSAYSDLRVFVRAITLSVSGEARVRVSTDNGSTFLSAAGDYLGVSGAGVESSVDALQLYSGNATAARSGEVFIEGFNLAAQRISRSNFFSTDSVAMRIIPTTTALNAVRVFATAGNLSGGTIFVFGRI